MTYSERKNIKYRVIATILILISIGLMIWSLVLILQSSIQDKIISILALAVGLLFASMESFFIVKGGKKELALYKIAFNQNGVVNNVPLFVVIVGTVFGAGLTALSIVLYFIKEDATNKYAALIILSICVYLLVNCIAYFTYVLMYKNRDLNIKDLLK